VAHPARTTPPADSDPAEDELAVVLPFPGAVAPDPVEPDEDEDEAPHVHTIECSPLYGETRLAGRIVTDPEEIAAIRRRVEAGVDPARFRAAWRRTLRRIRRQGVQS